VLAIPKGLIGLPTSGEPKPNADDPRPPPDQPPAADQP
jgi:hypothetical protein